MKSKLIVMALGLITISLSPISAKTMYCYNKHTLNTGLALTLNETDALLKAKAISCPMEYIPYHPVASKYQGWVRVAPTASCSDLEAVAMLLDGGDRHPSEIYWVSVSTEVQAGKDGFVQLGFENQWDPGAGGTVKEYLRCFPAR